MQSSNFSASSACRHCRYYTPEGRRGGHCNQLNVAVQSSWKACSLALPPFVTTWENIEELMVWQQRSLVAQEIPVTCHPEVEEIVEETGQRVSGSRQTVGLRALWM